MVNRPRNSGRQPAGSAGDGKTKVVPVKCLISLSGHLLRPVGSDLSAYLSQDSLRCYE